MPSTPRGQSRNHSAAECEPAASGDGSARRCGPLLRSHHPHRRCSTAAASPLADDGRRTRRDGVTGRRQVSWFEWPSLRVMVSLAESGCPCSEHHRGTTMEQYAGIDVSLESASMCVVDGNGRIVREVKVASEPEALIAWFRMLQVTPTRIGLEAGPLSQWLYAGMREAGLPVELLETPHVRDAFKAMPVKTDRTDAHGIAELMRLGWFRPVHCKSMEAQETRAMLTARKLVEKALHEVEMSVGGVLCGFGLKVGKVAPARFEARIEELVEGHPNLAVIAASLLAVRATLRREFNGFERR